MNRKFDSRWLWLVLAAVLIAALGAGWTRAGGQSFSAAESLNFIEQHRSDPGFVILDVRTPGEFNQGHIAGAVLLDFYAPGFAQALQSLDKEKTYLIYCRSGNRSGKTVAMAEKSGVSNVHHLANGIVEWQAEGYPLVKSRP